MVSTLNKRKERDLMKLMMSDYDVVRDESNSNEFYVTIQGPIDSAYEGVSFTP